jgi:hypothetical protein
MLIGQHDLLWRFVRAAVLGWLAGGHGAPDDTDARDEKRR